MLAGWIAALGLAAWMPWTQARRPFQPQTYRSQSGNCELTVDPLERYGDGAGDHVLRRAGSEVWRNRYPFTLADAVVAEDGTVAGYAYPDLGRQFAVVLIAADGRVLAHHATPRELTGIHGPFEPMGRGLVLDAERQRFIVCVDTPTRGPDWEEWQVFDLASGARAATLRPGEHRPEQDKGRILDAEAMDVPLFAIHWQVLRTDQDPWRRDARVTLVDLEGRQVWELALPGDLDDGNARDDENDAAWQRQRRMGFLDVASGGRFTIRSLRGRENLELRAVASEAGTAWSVEELGRSPFDLPAPDAEPAAETLALKRVASVDLRADPLPQPGPVRDIAAFGFDAVGNVMVVRRELEKGGHTCILLDPHGGLLLERSFGNFGQDMEWWPFEDGRWLVTAPSWGEGRDYTPHWVDPSRGTVEPIEGLALTRLRHLASAKDGFVALSNLGTFIGGVVHLDEHGGLRWISTEANRPIEAPSIHLLDRLAVTSTGLIVALDFGGEYLQLFQGDGTWIEDIELKGPLDNAECRASEIVADRDGGVLVYDFTSTNELGPWVRLDEDGTALGRIRPRRQDGSSDHSLVRNLVVAPDGRLWTHDRHTVMRLAQDCVVELQLGNHALAGSLHEPRASFVDARGRLLVLDGRTNAVHVFDRNGERTLHCVPDPLDFEDRLSMPFLAVGKEGDVHIGERWHSHKKGLLRFGARGERLGWAELGEKRVAFRPGTDERWVELYLKEKLALVAPNGNTLATIDRFQDRRWFGRIQDFAVAEDGSVAVLDHARFERGDLPEVAWFRADGTPNGNRRVRAAAEFMDIRASSAWIAVGAGSTALQLVRRADGALFQFEADVPGSSRSTFDFGFSARDGELWLIQYEPARLHRFKLP
jgi:hypothetical protein